MNYPINLREVTYALSEALDYVGVDDTLHGKRVAYMASEMGKRLNLDETEIDDLIMTGMLHDSGVSSTDVHSKLVHQLDWEDSQLHCEQGYILLQSVTFYRPYARAVLYHHTHWNLLPDTLDLTTRLHANLIFLADRIDALKVQIGSDTKQQKEEIRHTIRHYAGTMFAPELVDVFMEAALADSFWFFMESEALKGYFDHWILQGREITVGFEEIKAIAMMFAKIVDAKSSFTSIHTFGVASLARYLSELCKLPVAAQETIELSAFFHDLGKLRVADSILHKNGPLNEEERLQMNRHGFDSFIILQKIQGFQEIAKIASIHHETLDAHGYPFHLAAEQIPMEARILTVADIFQALVQDRPYRAGLSAAEAYLILDEMVRTHKIDGRIVTVVHEHLAACYEHAMKPDPFHSGASDR